jgi:hypothetical protein
MTGRIAKPDKIQFVSACMPQAWVDKDTQRNLQHAADLKEGGGEPDCRKSR